MKKLFYFFLATLMVLTGCSDGYDDSEIFDKYNDLQQEVKNLENEMDETKKLLNALANNLTIVSVKETTEGYLVTFSDGSTITVKHGTNGKDGADGKDGEDGKDGKDGIDGTDGKDGLNGKDGANGKDGVDGEDGKDGKDGDSFIESIEIDEDSVTFTLADGQVIVIPLGEKVVKNNQIFYTTTDGKKLFPNSTEPVRFGAILVSNTYENGQGILTFDDTVTTIGEEAFKDCYRLASIVIPDSVTSISNNAFEGCSNLTKLNGTNASEDGRCIVVDSVLIYFHSNNLTEYTIPDGVTTIGNYAFKGCTSLTSITIPDGVTTIGDGAFR